MWRGAAMAVARLVTLTQRKSEFIRTPDASPVISFLTRVRMNSDLRAIILARRRPLAAQFVEPSRRDALQYAVPEY